MDRAFSALVIKGAHTDGEFFVFSGMATTPNPDRVGDVIDPFGAVFAETIPLLWQHDSLQPVGRATFGKPTKSGIPFTAKIPFVKEDGALKTLTDLAIQCIKYALVTSVSVGFRVLDGAMERIKGGGFLFKAIEVLELSLATIPMHPEAAITAVKSLDLSTLPALGHEREQLDSLSPGATGQTKAVRRPIQLIKPRPLKD